jgi:hypothetical protein
LEEEASAGAAAGVWAWESNGEATRAKANVRRRDETECRVVIRERVGDLLRF